MARCYDNLRECHGFPDGAKAGRETTLLGGGIGIQTSILAAKPDVAEPGQWPDGPGCNAQKRLALAAALLGKDAPNLSPAVIARLTARQAIMTLGRSVYEAGNGNFGTQRPAAKTERLRAGFLRFA